MECVVWVVTWWRFHLEKLGQIHSYVENLVRYTNSEKGESCSSYELALEFDRIQIRSKGFVKSFGGCQSLTRTKETLQIENRLGVVYRAHS